MAEAVEPVIRVDIGDSQKTVKSLKDEINILRDKILNLQEGTEEYNNEVKKLQKSQRELDNVMSLTKKTATALEGSYDALVHQMGLLKKEWKSTNDEARRNELSKQISEINDQLKSMDAELGNFQRNVGNYQSALDGLDNTTVSFKQAMGEMNDTIEPTKAKFESVQKISSGVASGFAAVQGAAALLGIENENLEKTFLKVQSAMALAQGVGGLGDFVEGVGKAKVAFEGLGDKVKAVSKTMGKAGWLGVILLVITAVTTLTAYLIKKNKAIKDGTAAMKEFNKIEKESYKETIKDTLQLRLYNDVATDVNQSIKARRTASEELLKQLKMEVTETNILAGMNGKLTEKVDDVTEAMKRQAQATAYMEKLVSLQTELADIQLKGPNFWDKTLQSFKVGDVKDDWLGFLGLGGFIIDIVNNDGTEHWQKRIDDKMAEIEQASAYIKEKFGDIFGSDTSEEDTWKARYQTIVDSLKTEEQLLKEQYEKDLAMAEKYGSDKTAITKKYYADLKKIRDAQRKAAEANAKTILEISDADISTIERNYNRKAEYAKINAKTEEEGLQASYKILLEKEEEKLLVIKDALAEAYKDEEKNKDMIITLVQAKADQELAIEKLKFDELTRLRLVAYAKQGAELMAFDQEFSLNRRSLAIASDSSQDKRKRGFFGSLFGLGGKDDYKADKTQEGIDNKYYEDAYNQEQNYLNERLKLQQKFLAESTGEEQKLEFQAAIAQTELEIEESKYREKERLRQNDYKKEKEKQEKIQQIFNASLGATADLLGGLAEIYESDEENAEDNAQKIKNLRIAEATINTINGAVGAFSQASATIPPPAGQIIGGIQAAAVVASGIANINKIRQTTTDGSSNTLGAAVTPSASAYSSELPATYTRSITGASELDELNKDLRVVLVESDVIAAMEKNKVKVKESSF